MGMSTRSNAHPTTQSEIKGTDLSELSDGPESAVEVVKKALVIFLAQ